MSRLDQTHPKIFKASSQTKFGQSEVITSLPFTMSDSTILSFATEVDSYAESHLLPDAQDLKDTLDTSNSHAIPQIAVSPAQGKFLSLLTRLSGTRNVLEIGTLGGYSTICFAKALRQRGQGGKVTSIEILKDRQELAVQNLRNAGISVPDEAEVLLGSALDILPKLEAEIKQGQRPGFDFVLVDADWENHWPYFDYGVRLSNGAGSVIYVDNAVGAMRRYGIVGPGTDKKEVVSLVDKVGADSRVDAALMQTVGAKGHDGFLMAMVL
ncbi:S-adenosyl-L-methionine-dependent methyltransferase [Aspergillus taichungensis]|uniref:S-adenosyl-L-methionine-dependent methyltransferase n=1 Tax=Aspergillus taichungensis TaxID=482145 RepID=A0A2J5I8W0_9EURO|nr:S-adenosyl-L-methionine-dependent methyltransferase [Aspergillus taichungensis]